MLSDAQMNADRDEIRRQHAEYLAGGPPYEIHAIDPDGYSTILEEHATRSAAIAAWLFHHQENRNTTTISVEIWRDGQPVNETRRER